jgi:hypothetical protein
VGAYLGAGANSWGTISDSTKKENFKRVDGEEVLAKIRNFDLTSWNYKGQDPSQFRHYGPMAQDFYMAFGNDGIGVIGNDTTLSSADFDGVNLIAIQALEKRTNELKKKITEIENIHSEVQLLKAANSKLKNQCKELMNINNENIELKKKIVNMASDLNKLKIQFVKFKNKNSENNDKISLSNLNE